VIFKIKIKSQQKIRCNESVIPEHWEKSIEVTKYNKNILDKRNNIPYFMTHKMHLFSRKM